MCGRSSKPGDDTHYNFLLNTFIIIMYNYIKTSVTFIMSQMSQF